MSKPLNGIKILEISRTTAAAVCGLVLSEFGADVIKLENPNRPVEDRSSYAAHNYGKKAVYMDLSRQSGIADFYGLVKNSQAIITDMPEFLENPAFDYEQLRTLNPGITCTLISGYGKDGPCGARPSSDRTVQAESGIMSITGEENRPPVVCAGPIADYISAATGCIGTLMAILDADKTGHGRFVDVSAMDSLLFGLENQFSAFLKTGRIPVPIGNNYRLSAPVGVFPCKDGSLTISVATDTQWRAFAEALEHTEWLEDSRFSTVQKRIQNYMELNQAVTAAFSEYAYEELVSRLQSRHCIYGHLNRLDEVLSHPQVQHRRSFVTAEYEDGDAYTVPAVPIRMSGVEHESCYTVPSV